MEEKKNLIEEMANYMLEYGIEKYHQGVSASVSAKLREEFYRVFLTYAGALIDIGYRKISEGAVVLTKEEYEDLKRGVKTIRYTAMFNAGQQARISQLEERLEQAYELLREEIVKELLQEIGEEACEHHYLNRDCEWFSRICKKYGMED